MSDYARANTGGATHFGDKDGLTTGDADKVIVGAQFDTEFNAIVTASATKYDSGNLASQAQAEAGTANTVLMTPLRVQNWADANGGMVGDIQALTDPGADRILFWDDGAGAVAGLAVSTGLTLSGTTLTSNDAAIVHDSLSGFVADEHVAHSGVSITAGTGMTGGGTIAATRTLNVVGGNGITANANDIAITDQSVTSSVPVGFSSGALTFDLSSITEILGKNISQSADAFLVSDAGVLKRVTYDEQAILVQTVAGTTDTIAQADMNTFIEYTAATAVTVTLNTGVGDIGNILILKQTGAGQVTVAGTATVEYSITPSTRTTDSVITLVCIAANTWALFGDQG